MMHNTSEASPADLPWPAGEEMGLEKRSLPSVDREFQKEVSCKPLSCPLLSRANSCMPHRAFCQSLRPYAQRAAPISLVRLHHLRE